MKLSKKKVFALALAVCLIATLSMGTLAWFTDQDSVKNDFMIAGSEDGEDKIFSVDVWEEGDDNDDGLLFEDILPNAELEKIAHVKNTGSYDQFIRVRIEVTNADVWQDVYDANMVPVTEFVNVDLNALYGIGAYQEGNSFVYYLYYNEVLKHSEDNDMVIFDTAYISEHLTREQAAKLPEGFDIIVTADAVQTEHVGENVYEAFETVGMGIAVNTTYVSSYAELKAAVGKDGYIVLMGDITQTEQNLNINKTVNIYLNDYTLTTVSANNPNYYGFKIHGDVTIGGYGLVSMPGLRGMQVDGVLSIYGGTFEDAVAQPDVNETLIYVTSNGVVNVADGTFNGEEYCVYVYKGTANIWGGNFTATVESVKY